MKILKDLVFIQLKGLFFSSASSKSKKYIMSILYIYVVIYFSIIFKLLFDTLLQPFHMLGLDWLYFSIMSIISVLFCFMLSIFMTYQVVYDSKDNELLLSMPIPPILIIISRLITLYIFIIVFQLLICLPAVYVYITDIGLSIIQIIIFISVMLTLPLVSIVLSCLLSYILGHLIIKTKSKNIVTFGFFLLFFIFYFRFMGNIQDYITQLIVNGEQIADVVRRVLFPFYHLGISLSDTSLISLAVYLIFIFIPFIILLYVLKNHFIKMALYKTKETKSVYKIRQLKSNHLYVSLIKREFIHLFSNVNVVLNGCIGVFMSMFACVGVYMYKDNILLILSLFEYKLPIIAIAVCLVGSMTMISSSLLSLEGRSLWILKSLPLSSKQVLLSKFFTHLVLTLVPSLILIITISVILDLSLIQLLIILLSALIYNIFTGLSGIIINVLIPNFNWINEIVCVKQSMSSLAGMLVDIGMLAGIAILYRYINIDMDMYFYIIVAIMILIDIVLYIVFISDTVKRYEKIDV